MTPDRGSAPARELRTECTGFSEGAPAGPCLMVLLGASGDLARRELLPSLFELATRDLLPDRFAVVGFARSDWSDDAFRDRMRGAVREECRFDAETWETLAGKLYYVPGDFTDGENYGRLADRIGEVRERHDLPDRVFFHLAAPPGFFEPIVHRLNAAGLARAGDDGWRRLVVEKPFGRDRRSAVELDRELRDVFAEEEIYRIDHFLGKETVQNMLVFRFGNPAFEPIWNRNYIDHVQITVAEEIGVGTRGSFYESTGVVRDMVQNHLLQLLCLTAVEPPVRYDGRELRDETAKVLRSAEPVDLDRGCVRGQYGRGTVDGEEVPGYREEEDVDPDSTTATFAALELELDTWRWADVPFYLRTGKRMERKLTEVAIQFRPTPHVMFPRVEDGEAGRAHVLAFRLQPREGILQTFLAKRPGPGLELRRVTMEFRYADAFQIENLPRAYAWLLLDVMQGDQTLFARSDWIREAWSIVDPVVERWENTPPEDFPNYRAGGWGPPAAGELPARSGRRWREV